MMDVKARGVGLMNVEARGKDLKKSIRKLVRRMVEVLGRWRNSLIFLIERPEVRRNEASPHSAFPENG